ncbi:MAG: hydroxymethylbilane synthase [Syntrophobacteraceae bacterium]|nr:hydroxymethylbilane synthase [Syntrophobacteraceae bacterium]
MTGRVLRIGTRGSLLALNQSEWVKGTLEKLWPDLAVELRIIKTTGDRILDVPLAKVGGKGLFVKEIEDALLAGTVDLAVHSMKDVPSALPAGLRIGAIPEREDPRDVFISTNYGSVSELPMGARVGTSSLRRSAQLKSLRSDLHVETLRGNLDTRLRKLGEGLYDAIILAAAGLHRMGWREKITAYLDPAQFLPAIGQGALGIEVRSDDNEVARLIGPLHHPETAHAVEAERGFLKELEGGCQVPIGGFARVDGAEVELTGLVASLDGTVIIRRSLRGPREEAAEIGRRLAREVLRDGAGAILDEAYREASRE